MKPKSASSQLSPVQENSLAMILCGNVRRFRGWTVQSVADHLGVSHTTVLRWERGKRVPPDEYLQAYIALVIDEEPGHVTILHLLSHLRALVQRHEQRRGKLIDEATDNLIALGLDPQYVGILDNECLKHTARPCANYYTPEGAARYGRRRTHDEEQ